MLTLHAYLYIHWYDETSYMDRLTVTIHEDHTALLDQLSGEGGPCDNRSESMRYIISAYENQQDLEGEIEELEKEIDSLENRLEESRRREIARDKTNQEIDVLREELSDARDETDAPFFVKWYRWYRRRG